MKLEIFGWIITASKTAASPTLEQRAEAIQRAFDARFIGKVEAVKSLRELFRDAVPCDERGTLRGALYFIERRLP